MDKKLNEAVEIIQQVVDNTGVKIKDGQVIIEAWKLIQAELLKPKK